MLTKLNIVETEVSKVAVETGVPKLAIEAAEPILHLGLNAHCSNQVYHADRLFYSSSVLKSAYKDLNSYYDEYILGNKREIKNRAPLEEGSLAHTLILEPHLLNEEYAIFPGWVKRGAEFDSFVASLPPGDKRTIISAPQLNRVERWVETYKNHPEARALLLKGVPEQTICALINDMPIKTRFDWVDADAGVIVDVKTTGYSGDVDSFKATCDGLMYDLSAALYLAVAEAHYNRPFDFYFIVLSKKDITCDVYKLSANSRIQGMQKVNKALDKLKKAKETGIYQEPAETKSEVLKYEILEI